VSSDEHVLVCNDRVPVADSRRALRILETASPPTYYIPAADIDWHRLVEIPGSSFCEWKGRASYFALADDPEGCAVGWLYANPSRAFAAIHNHASFYPGRIRCEVNGEVVRAQAGDFYGGWITGRVVGPFKGDPGTGHW
jgi:uncharacterized protein (DUF427 family)